MTVEATLASRKGELQRRVKALPNEVKQWKDRTINNVDSNLHFSQLQTIGILIDTFAIQQNAIVAQLDPVGDQETFHIRSLELIENIIRSQRVWDFFRDKLDLRFSPLYKDALWVADTVAWDCHRPVLAQAADDGIVKSTELREPPLTYLTAEFSPATWIRGSQPNDGHDFYLGTSLLPIPVIELPWDHVENIWEFMSLHHEVGHDLEADLKLSTVLETSLHNVLTANGVPDNRVKQWGDWLGEVFPDLVGLQLGGPAFAEALMNLLLLPSDMVTTLNTNDPHPTHYPRILINAMYIPTMIPGNQPLIDHGKQIAEQWKAIYGNQPQFDDFLNDAPFVFQALMDTAFPEMKGKTVRELMPYLEADDQRIRKAVGYMLTGMDKPTKSLRPRHCISAARMAVTEAAQNGTLTNTIFDQINKRTSELVHSNAPDGLRGGDNSTPHNKFIASFVDKL